MNIFKNFFKHHINKTNYSDEDIMNLSGVIKNKVITLKMKSPYNKVIISEISECKYINGIRFIELIGYNLNRQKLSLILRDTTFINICNGTHCYESTGSDDIYLKDIQNLDKK